MMLYRLLTDEARSIYGTSINCFSDVPRNAWYATAVSTLTNIGIINGYRDWLLKNDPGADSGAHL